MFSVSRALTACALLGPLLAVLSGCGVGQGKGEATGDLFVLGCSYHGDYCSGGLCGTADTPAPYDLRPSFFVGEPFDDPRLGQAGTFILSNRIVLRLQRSGLQQDLNDVLTFEFLNSYEVARCVRGRKLQDANGTIVPDWNTTLCERTSDTGPVRVRLHSAGLVRAFLTPRATCSAAVVGTASAIKQADLKSPTLGTADLPWESWIELQEFGSASEPFTPDPLLRKPVDRQFRVSLGQRLQVTNFRLLLIDDRILSAIKNFESVPPAMIGGQLSGYFDFDLVRGQGAQTFP